MCEIFFICVWTYLPRLKLAGGKYGDNFWICSVYLELVQSYLFFWTSSEIVLLSQIVLRPS